MGLLAIILTIPLTVIAQDVDVGTPPVLLTPGEPFRIQVGEIIATLPFTDLSCYTAFPLVVGDQIFIEPGVNIRAEPGGSSAIVWNTAYNQYDENGEALVLQDQINMEAFITGGPVCRLGYNWWQVDFPAGMDGWVSEGRPTDKGGYLFSASGIDFNETCESPFDLVAGNIAMITQNVRVREAPNTAARVMTVAPLGSEFTLLEGPACDVRTGVGWFRIRVTVVDFTYEGWIAQGQGGAFWLIPTNLPSEEAGTLCGAPLNFAIGDIGYVDPRDERPRNLRDGPGLNSNILYMLVDGVPFAIMGGPTCVNNINWWQIRVLSSSAAEGWIAEGSQGVGYWLSESEQALVEPRPTPVENIMPGSGGWILELNKTMSSVCNSTGTQTLVTSEVYGESFTRVIVEVEVTGSESFILDDILVSLISHNTYYGQISELGITTEIYAEPVSAILIEGQLIFSDDDCVTTVSYVAIRTS
jgi:hypothetical protein